MAVEEQRELERRIFGVFLKVVPDFAKRISGDWTQPEDDPPDIRFSDTDGRAVGVELKAWINEEQIAQAKKREKLEGRFLDALNPQPKNPGGSVSFVWLSPAGPQTPSSNDVGVFKSELLSLVAEHDSAWAAKGQTHSELVDDFEGRPTLGRYLGAMTLFPRNLIDPKEGDWLGFPFSGGPYAEKDMLVPLQDLITDNMDKYRTTKAAKKLDWIVLLIHYDARAFRYNSPIDALDWGFDLFAESGAFHHFAMDLLSPEGEKSPWDEVFLLDAVNGRVRRIHPAEPAKVFG